MRKETLGKIEENQFSGLYQHILLHMRNFHSIFALIL